MNDHQGELDLRHVLRVLRRRAWLIGLLVVVAAGAAFAFDLRAPKVYESTSEVRVSNPNANSVFSQSGQPAVDPKRLVDTETKVVQSNDIRDAVDAELGDRAALIQTMVVTNPTGTDLLDISVTSTSPEVARDAANLFAKVYVGSRVDQRLADLNARAAELRKQADQLADEIAGLPAGDPGRTSLQTAQSNFTNLATQNEAEAALLKGNLQVVDTAQLPQGSVSPKPRRDAAVAGALALLLGIGLALLLERLDDRIESPEDLAEVLPDLASLGAVPIYAPNKKRGTAAMPEGPRVLVPRHSIDAEVYRTIRANVRFSGIAQAHKVLMVTSALPGEGKSTVTANLAASMAEDGLRVLVVAGDLRRPSLPDFFTIDRGAPGLTDILLGQDVWSVMLSCSTESGDLVHVIPTGPLPPNPAELLGSARMRGLLDDLRAAPVDYVLIDAPPVLPVSDPLTLAQEVDATILVAAAGRAKAEPLREAVSRLRAVDTDILGVVLNGVATNRGSSTYQYYRRYGSYEAAPPTTVPAPRPTVTGDANLFF